MIQNIAVDCTVSKHENGITLMDWLALSVDVNSIENVRLFSKMKFSSKRVFALKQVSLSIGKIRLSLSEGYVESFVESTEKRSQVRVDSAGTNYKFIVQE